MFSLFIGIICIIGLVIGTILSVSDFGIFFDAPAFGIVIVGAFLYSLLLVEKLQTELKILE